MSHILASAGYQKQDNIWLRPSQAATFSYSDGDESENRLLKICTTASDTSLRSPQLAASITDWPSYYHLSPTRANLIRPIESFIKGPVLEIGAGCGAITRYLGERGFEVIALEGGIRRAQIIGQRCRDLPNVSVLAEPFQDFQPDVKFGTITLIGVLEYARVFFGNSSDRDAVDLMLEKVRSMLAPDGILIVAIENQLGLKYLAGYSEDHLGRPMVGIEDQYTASTVVTFGKRELSGRVGKAGLGHQQWWFPFPDYKMPAFALSERAIARDIPTDFASLIRAACQTDPQKPAYTAFAPELAWDAIARNGLQGDLANSFLLLASAQEIAQKDVVAYHFSDGGRLPQFTKTVEFVLDGDRLVVKRVPLQSGAAAVQTGALASIPEDEVFEPGLLWRDAGYRLLMRHGWSINELSGWMKIWWHCFRELLQSRGEAAPKRLTDGLAGGYIDALPRNLILGGDDRGHFIDLEWVNPQPVEAGFVLFRAMWDLLWEMQYAGEPAAGTSTQIAAIMQQVFLQLGFPLTADDLVRYYEMEMSFREAVIGKTLRRDPAAMFRSLRPRIGFAEAGQQAGRVVALEGQVETLRRELDAERQKVAQMLEVVDQHVRKMQRGA